MPSGNSSHGDVVGLIGSNEALMAEIRLLSAPAASLICKSTATGPHVLSSSIVAENVLLAGRQTHLWVIGLTMMTHLCEFFV